jgi:ABC-2 type transport system permease protein
MKVLDIARKDLLRSFRSAFALVFMFVIPLLTVGLFYFAFGGLGSGDEGFELATTQVQVVNLDAPDPQFGDFSAGQTLIDLLQSEELASLLAVTEVQDAASARAAVDNQEAGVAVIIPADFTAAVFNPDGSTAVELYQDPTLTIGAGIVKDILNQFVDGFAATKIATGVSAEQLTEHGVTVDAAIIQDIVTQYVDWTQQMGESQRGSESERATSPMFEVQSTTDDEDTANHLTQQILSLTMAGMMIFYAFFTGANSSESILREEEAGTLPRLFTTPTPQSTILGGKFIAVFVTLLVQVVVLVSIAALVFKVEWGAPLPLALVTVGLVVLASSFGIFLTSLLKNTKQTGIIFGGLMTVTGMVGISSTFTASVPGAAEATKVVDTLSLFVPQGWAMRGWRLVMDGGGVVEVLPTVAVMLALGIAFFVLGVLRFRKRFA